jgi:AraC-like DNA-binding protein
MRNLVMIPSDVMYPQKEQSYVLMGRDHAPFTNAMIGITYPYAAYQIHRGAGNRINLFELVLEGKGEVWIDGAWQAVEKGDMYIMVQGQEQRYRSNPSDPMKKIWINYEADYMSAFLDAYGIQSGIYKSERAGRYLERAFQYTQTNQYDPFVCFEVASCVNHIVHTIATEQQQEGGDAYRICMALHAAVYETLSLDELADSLHISKSNVIRVFKKEYGVTPYEYLLRLKIDAAKLLLCNTEMSVREIAERVCIADPHYFSTLFLSRVGVRPREYRKQKRSTP